MVRGCAGVFRKHPTLPRWAVGGAISVALDARKSPPEVGRGHFGSGGLVLGSHQQRHLLSHIRQ